MLDIAVIAKGVRGKLIQFIADADTTYGIILTDGVFRKENIKDIKVYDGSDVLEEALLLRDKVKFINKDAELDESFKITPLTEKAIRACPIELLELETQRMASYVKKYKALRGEE